ncbi:MAG TPA: hypothetical protein VE591_01760 [Candidatus Acidoferrum sp.]|nr:hypothetical protein [Candidatus Acidoferrum sp.]
MLNELLRRIAGRGDRREGWVRKRFPIAWLDGATLVPALGLEISEKGLLFATKGAQPPVGGTLDVAIDVEGRRVRARLTVERKGTMVRDGVEWAVIGGLFQAIAADDWDAIVRFCKGQSAPPNKAADELSALAGIDDDAYRLLPLKVQQRVVSTLTEAGRLAPESDAKNPLLRMSYGGKTRAGVHRLAVHSRRHLDGEVLAFDSVLTVDDAGNVQLER